MTVRRSSKNGRGWRKAAVGLLVLTAALVLLGGTALAQCTSVTAQDISLGDEVSVTITHCVINMTGSNWHRIVITGPGGYSTEYRFQTSAGTHTFTSPSAFPTPTVAGTYEVTFEFGVKFWMWYLWDDDSAVATTFTVTGGTSPTITCPGNITKPCDPGACGAVVTWSVSASGDPAPTVTCNPASGTLFPVGTTLVTCTATNDSGTDSCSFTVTVNDAQPPAIACPDPLVLNAGDLGNQAAYAAWLDSATASDLCDQNPTITDNGPAFSGLPIGCSGTAGTIVTWTATDASGNTSTCTSTVKLIDTTPPQLSLSVSPSTLWPVNHKLVDITITAMVSDDTDPNPTITLVSIESSEPGEVNAGGDGKTEPDIQGAAFGTADFGFQLRAERQGGSNGRTYTITYCATDSCGNSAFATAEVIVPHDQSK
jgi:hypothetical protein